MNIVEHRCATCFLPAPVGHEFCSETCRQISRDFETEADPVIEASIDQMVMESMVRQ